LEPVKRNRGRNKERPAEAGQEEFRCSCKAGSFPVPPTIQIRKLSVRSLRTRVPACPAGEFHSALPSTPCRRRLPVAAKVTSIAAVAPMAFVWFKTQRITKFTILNRRLRLTCRDIYLSVSRHSFSVCQGLPSFI
jgi:hypothetical protein